MLAGARESFIKTFFISEIDFACLELTCNVGFFQWYQNVRTYVLCSRVLDAPSIFFFSQQAR